MRSCVCAVVACAIAACGPAREGAAPPIGMSHHERAGDASDAGARRAASDGGAVDALPTLAEIAARGPLVAPGMREIAKLEQAADRQRADVTRATSRDVCVRLELVASAPVIARLEDGAGTLLAESAASERGSLGARGPVCVRRGEVVRVSFDASAPARVRWVAWASP